MALTFGPLYKDFYSDLKKRREDEAAAAAQGIKLAPVQSLQWQGPRVQSAPSQSIWDKTRDIFDANSPMDKFKRQQAGEPVDYLQQQKQVYGKPSTTNPALKIIDTIATPIVEAATGYGLHKQSAGELTQAEAAKTPGSREVILEGGKKTFVGPNNRTITPRQEIENAVYGRLMFSNPLGAKAVSTVNNPVVRTAGKMAVEGAQNVMANTYANVLGDANQVEDTNQDGQITFSDRVVASLKQAPEQFAQGLPFGLLPGGNKAKTVTPKVKGEVPTVRAAEAPSAPVAKVIQKTQAEVPTVRSVEAPPVRAKVTPAAEPQVAIKNGLYTQAKTALVEGDSVIIDTLRRFEKKTGKTGLVDQFMVDTGLVSRSNAIANQKVQSNPNLKAAIGGLGKKDLELFNAYSTARSELYNATRGLPTSMPVKDLQEVFDVLDGKFGKRFDSMNAYYKDYAKDLYDAGIIDEVRYKQFTSNPDYIRTQRDMTDLVGRNPNGGRAYSMGSTMTKQKRTGSQRDMLPADLTALDYAQQAEKEIARNRVATNLIDSLQEMGLAKKISSSDAARKNTMKRMVNGVTEVYEVPAEIKKVVDNINPYQLNALERIVSAPKRVFQAGTTGLNLPFALANYLKDQGSSAINSSNIMATHSPRNILSGIWQATKDFGIENNNPLWQKFMAYSGDITQFDMLRNVESAKKASREIRRGNLGRAGNRALQPIRTLEDFISITEKATRFQNFKGVYEKAIKEGLSDTEATQKAILAAWQNSVDFNRFGTWGKTLNLIIPYFNSGIQGSRQLTRAFAKRPVATTVKTVAFLGMPMAGLTAYNLSDPETKAVYDNISEFEKENNFILIPPGTQQNEDGTYDIIKIPLPQGYGDLVTPLRRTMEAYANDNPVDFPKIAGDMLNAISGPINTVNPGQNVSSLTPQVIKPFVQQAANKDFFTGKPIVPDYVNEAVDANGNPIAENQKAYPYTSGSARILGDATNQSPIRIEKFIKDSTGKVGQYVVNAVDKGLAATGAISEDQVGGISPVDDVKRRFTKAQGEYNYKKSEGAKYYDNVKTVSKGLNKNEESAFNTLHPSKTNFLGEDIFDENKRITKFTKAGIYLQYPKVYEADKNLDKIMRDQGKPGNPLYDLPKDQLTRVLLKATLPPGAKDPELSNLYKEEWYQDYNAKRSKYYASLQESLKKEGKSLPKSDNPYPETPQDLQKVMDTYSALPKGTGARSSWIKANPGLFDAMKNQWAAVDSWENKERVAIGLSPIDQESSSSGGYSKYGSSGGSRKVSMKAPETYGTELRTGATIKKPTVKKIAMTSSKPKTVAIAKPKVSMKKSKV